MNFPSHGKFAKVGFGRCNDMDVHRLRLCLLPFPPYALQWPSTVSHEAPSEYHHIIKIQGAVVDKLESSFYFFFGAGKSTFNIAKLLDFKDLA